MFDGRPFVVAPVVMIVEGVLNGGLLTRDEFARDVETWNGRPIPVYHPQDTEGRYIFANSPEVWQKSVVGQLFNARVDGDKLIADLWLDVQKAQRLGHGELVAAIERGEVVEVSTGYLTDPEPAQGEFNGTTYTEIHRNIRPDHLALLPGEIGACSVADGCGSNRGESIGMKVAQALAAMVGLKLKTNCKCNGEQSTMTKEQKLAALKAHAAKMAGNEKITPEMFDLIATADPEQLAQIAALIAALGVKAEGDDDMPAAAAAGAPAAAADGTPAKPLTEDDVAAMVCRANRRHAVMAALRANDANPFTEEEMKTLPVETLERTEQRIRPADYGLASVPATVTANAGGYSPMGRRPGVLVKPAAK